MLVLKVHKPIKTVSSIVLHVHMPFMGVEERHTETHSEHRQCPGCSVVELDYNAFSHVYHSLVPITYIPICIFRSPMQPAMS